MMRYDLINWFVREYGYSRYLEIGVDNPLACINLIKCPHKIGVDPNKGKTVEGQHYRMGSDEFFRLHHDQFRFDIVFVDGLHTAPQAHRDVIHALQMLERGGTIVMHDCWPHTESEGSGVRTQKGPWCGDVWRAWAALRATQPQLHMRVVMADHGLGVIRRGTQPLYAGPRDTWGDYVAHRDEILLPVDPEDVAALYGRGA